jgi:putative redox protein
MHAQLSYVGGTDGASWKAETQTGHSIILDGSEAIGGKNLGPRPMEIVLLGLGSCSAMDVLSILRKGRKTVDQCVIQLKATRAETIPKVFTHIQMHYQIKGQELTDLVVERAICLSKEKYCSVAQMLMPETEIQTSYEFILN